MKDFALRFLLPLGIDAATLAAICMLYMDNLTLTVLIAIIFSFTLLFRFSYYKLTLAFLATLFGTVGEVLCCFPGIELWIYENPSFYSIPSWLPMIWPILMMTFAEMASYINEFFTTRVKKELYSFVLNLAATILLVYAVYTFLHIQWVIATVFFLFLVFIFVFAKAPYNIVLFGVGAFGGFLGEYICLQSGVWHYTRPFYSEIGVPLSLPLAWGLSLNIIFILTRLCLGQSRDQLSGYGAEV